MSISLLVLAIAGQAAAPPAPRGAQALFDAGSAAASDGRCAEAVPLFDQLEASGAAKRNALLAAMVDVRKGRCLVDLARGAEGKAAILRGLPVLKAKGQGWRAQCAEVIAFAQATGAQGGAGALVVLLERRGAPR